jgi:endonuclease/exonuclease/phosphatase family metal-dependent hydrolase
MAANLTSGNGQDYDPGHGNRMIQALKPDIVLVQEMSYLSNSPSDLRAWIDATFGAGFHYYREPAAGIPNGIVSRFPILAAGEWDDPVLENREFAWARIDIPGRRDLWAVSVHFKASSNCAPQRREQARELVKQLTSAIPAQDYVVLGGDLNTSERAESCIRTLASYFVTSGPYPADTHGNSETNAGRDKPYDWVLADQELETKRVPLILGSLQFPNGLVFDTRTYDPLTELPPAERTDSGAANMQHMAVLRAFAFPAQD